MNIESLCDYVYEDLNGRITAVALDEDLVITFICDSAENPRVRRCFELTCHHVRESTAQPSHVNAIEYFTDHPLLWDANDQHGYLYYSSAPANRHELFARIWAAHERVFGGFRPVTEYANAFFTEGALNFCPDANGLMADGPKRILDIYAAAAGDALQLKFVPSARLGRNAKALVFDDCFVICDSVSVVEKPH